MRNRDAPLTVASMDALAWDRMDGLLPAVVQDRASGQVLMLGYMDRAALAATFASGLVTFWSRSKQRLWTKGESSGNVLRVTTIHADCDGDALLVRADPAGPVCHLGTVTCFGDAPVAGPGWLAILSSIIADRATSGDDGSYTRGLLESGIGRIAQKVGEEGVEVALAAVTALPEQCAAEVADLLYHVAVLMKARGIDWTDVVATLQARHEERGQHR